MPVYLTRVRVTFQPFLYEFVACALSATVLRVRNSTGLKRINFLLSVFSVYFMHITAKLRRH